MNRPFELASVVTVPYFPKGAESVVRALRILLGLPVGRVILVFDVKSQAGRSAADWAIAKMCPEFEAQGRELALLEVDTSNTAPRWRLGITEAFKDQLVQLVFVFPGDLDRDPNPENLTGWAQMVADAEPNALILGDYDSNDRFKKEFDELLAWEAVEVLFPHLCPQLRALGHSKLRTEFLIIGRAAFDSWRQQETFGWGPDPTVPVTLAILEGDLLGKNVTVKPPVKLGLIEDNPDQRTPLGQARQLLRFTAALAVARVMAEQASQLKPPAQLPPYRELQAALRKLFDATIHAVARNGDILEKMLLPAP